HQDQWLPYLCVCRHLGRAGAAHPDPHPSQPSTGWLNPSVPCTLTQDMKLDGSRRFRHAMNFPAELVKGIQAQGVEQELVCIYIHSPCIFQDTHNSSVLNNYVLGAYLRSGHVAGLSQPVEIQIWHDMVLVSRTLVWAQTLGCLLLSSSLPWTPCPEDP
uniref:Uncharacterized protein n=1 Tax=Athene cunicularia TaxID=194338 RepID=A0A663MSV2_ATHCN